MTAVSDSAFYELPAGAILIVIDNPILTAGVLKQFKQLDHRLKIKWERIYERWGIYWIENLIIPHRIMFATHRAISDGQAYKQMQKNLWYSKQSYKRMAEKMIQRSLSYHDHVREHDIDERHQMFKEVGPALMSLKDAGRSSHGKSKFKFSGFGDGGGTRT